MRDIGAVTVHLTILLALTGFTQFVYGSHAGGVPDAGMVPIVLIPWLFWSYNSAGLNPHTSPGIFSVWLASACTFIIPAFVSLVPVRRKREFLIWLAAPLGVLGYAAYQMHQYMVIFTLGEPRPSSFFILKHLKVQGWLLGLTIIGASAGLMVGRAWRTTRKANQAL